MSIPKNIMKKIQYFNRVISAYILRKDSQLTFWHKEPRINENAFQKKLTPH